MSRFFLVLALAMGALAPLGCINVLSDEPFPRSPDNVWVPPPAPARPSERERAAPQPPFPRAERTGNVTISVDRIAVDETEVRNVAAIWKYADENVVIQGGANVRRNGIRAGVATRGFAAALQTALEQSRSKKQQRIFITTLSGSTGMISMGGDVFVEVLRYWTPFGESVLLQRAWVGASLVVEPTILPGDKVRVKLYPRFSSRDGKTIDLTEAATEVILQHGQPLVMSGLEQSTDTAGWALFSRTEEHRTQNVTLIVTPSIEGAQ